MAERGAKPNVPTARAAGAEGDQRLHLAAAARRLPRADQPAVVDARAARRVERVQPRDRRRGTVVDPARLRLARPRAGPVPAHRRRDRRHPPLARLLAHLRPGPPRRLHLDHASSSSTTGKRLAATVTRGCEPGTIVCLGDVEGKFVLPDPLPEKLLFISAGSGITPIMAMLREPRARGRAAATSCTCTPRATPEMAIFGERLRELADAQRRLPAARAAHRASEGPHHARPTSTSSAPTGASARPSSRGPAECSTR